MNHRFLRITVWVLLLLVFVGLATLFYLSGRHREGSYGLALGFVLLVPILGKSGLGGW